MAAPRRPLCIHHCTSEPFQFFGRSAELALLNQAFGGGEASLVAMVGPGGQGKTAIVQTWLQYFLRGEQHADGVFLWSFYRGKDADLCLRELYRYAQGLEQPPEVSASYCVDHLLPVLRRERWALVLDGTEVVQHETGSWFGRFVHPEMGRLLEELAAEPLPGVAIVTTRFPLPTLEHRKHARLLSLSSLDSASAVGLLRSLGVQGPVSELEVGARLCGHHAKAVELLGTWLVQYHSGQASQARNLPPETPEAGSSDEETKVARVLTAYQEVLSAEARDILALATAFRHPPTERQLLEYLASVPVHKVLHQHWERTYVPFAQRPAGWLAGQVHELVKLRLLERVHSGHAETVMEPHQPEAPARGWPHQPEAPARGEAFPSLALWVRVKHDQSTAAMVIDAHPLVRRGFEALPGGAGHRHHAQARAGDLRGRPDRRPPGSLEEAREEVELFHAYADAGMWNETDGVLVALDNPKHRFLAPAFERDLLLRFFPHNDWRQPPLWSGFGRYRSLAICFELLGQFEEALLAYPATDAPLRGDALIALGRLAPLVETAHVGPPWQNLWQAYRAHALCLAGRIPEALALARTLVPVDVYEWVHVFECLFRAGQLALLDIKSILYRPAFATEHRWSGLARQRMRLDYLSVMEPRADLGKEYQQILEEYDRGGMPFERALTRLRFARWLLDYGEIEQGRITARAALELATRFGMTILAADARELLSYS